MPGQDKGDSLFFSVLQHQPLGPYRRLIPNPRHSVRFIGQVITLTADLQLHGTEPVGTLSAQGDHSGVHGLQELFHCLLFLRHLFGLQLLHRHLQF